MGDPEDLLAEARMTAAARAPDLDLPDLRRRARRYQRRKRAARIAAALAPVLAVIPLVLSGPSPDDRDDRLDLAEQPDATVAPPATRPAPSEPIAASPLARPAPPPPAPSPVASSSAVTVAPAAPVAPATGAPEPPGGGWIEAEGGALTAPMVVHLEAGAADAPSTPSGGAFVMVPERETDGSSPDRPGALDLDVTVPDGGTYLIWARVRAPSHASNSFLVTVDDGDADYWWLPPLDSPDWRWLPVTERGPLTPRRYDLATGPHRLRFRNREDGTAIDRVLVTSDPDYVPVGPDASP